MSKLRKVNLLDRRATTADKACIGTRSVLDFTKHKNFRVTKLIEDYTLFQDMSINDLKVDENVVKMQKKYSLE
jgi:hypothetical protein